MPDRDLKNRVLGGSPTRTVIQLVVASIVVGAIFSFLGLGPREFWEGLFDAFQGLIRTLGESFGEIVGNLIAYLLIGAAVVVPIWLVSRLLSKRK